MSKVTNSDVQVREISRDDLVEMRRYFFESSPEFLNSIGLKTPQSGDVEIFQEKWEQRFCERETADRPIAVFTVLYRGEKVGFHTSTHHVPGKSLIMHAHFFRKDLSRRGIGTVSCVLAIEKFLTEYGYQEVIFKTPKQNIAPMKIKEKLGLSAISEETIDWPALVKPLQVNVFRVTATDLKQLRSRAGL